MKNRLILKVDTGIPMDDTSVFTKVIMFEKEIDFIPFHTLLIFEPIEGVIGLCRYDQGRYTAFMENHLSENDDLNEGETGLTEEQIVKKYSDKGWVNIEEK